MLASCPSEEPQVLGPNLHLERVFSTSVLLCRLAYVEISPHVPLPSRIFPALYAVRRPVGCRLPRYPKCLGGQRRAGEAARGGQHRAGTRVTLAVLQVRTLGPPFRLRDGGRYGSAGLGPTGDATAGRLLRPTISFMRSTSSPKRCTSAASSAIISVTMLASIGRSTPSVAGSTLPPCPTSRAGPARGAHR